MLIAEKMPRTQLLQDTSLVDTLTSTQQTPANTSEPDKNQEVIDLALAVIDAEIEAIQQMKSRLNSRFSSACDLIIECNGRVVVIGMGKSGHIGRKIAATLASTGTPAFFVHPGEASHGDMGMVTPEDLVIAISNSGETPEIISILPLIKLLGIPMISISGNPDSTIATTANINLDASVAKEACPLGLAPTSSTTTALVMGDALAIALLQTKGFSADDFARFHPGGTLGRRLLTPVSKLMRTGDAVPMMPTDQLLSTALPLISDKRLGMGVVLNPDQTLAGIFTDGDLRRALQQHHSIEGLKLNAVMTKNPQTITSDILAEEAVQLMEQRKITSLVVLDTQQKPLGILHLHDLLCSGIL